MTLEDEKDQTEEEGGSMKKETSTATREQNKAKPSSRVPEGMWSRCLLDLEPIRLIWDFGSQILENNFPLFQAKSAGICHSSPGN